MKRILSIHGYDCLDQINYACRIREYQDYENDVSSLLVSVQGTLPGRGLDDPHDWLRDVLVAVLESL